MCEKSEGTDLPERVYSNLDALVGSWVDVPGFDDAIREREVVRALHVRPEQCYFWATHQGAELDLLVVREARRRGFEFKRTDAPGVTKSMRVAIRDLGLESIDVIHAGSDTYPLSTKIRALAHGLLDGSQCRAILRTPQR